MLFREQAEEMGLTISGNSYLYTDRHSSIKYMELQTVDDVNGEEIAKVPLLGIFTKAPNGELYRYTGFVSQVYKFIGNEAAIEKIRAIISSVGSPIFAEYNLLNHPRYTQMFSEILIGRQNTIPEVGMVYPQISINNSYDGHRGIEISFGLSLYSGTVRDITEATRYSFSFREKLGTFKQIHSQYSRTVLGTALGSYVTMIGNNILSLFRENYNKVIDEQTLLATLDVVEGIGKRRRIDISDYLHQLNEERKSSTITAWDLFIAITKFSTVEKNINAKKLLEEAAERILVVPSQMIDALEEINMSTTR